MYVGIIVGHTFSIRDSILRLKHSNLLLVLIKFNLLVILEILEEICVSDKLS